jgi:hypothetical protein
MPRHIFPATVLVGLAGALACKELDRNPSSPNGQTDALFVKLVPELDSVGVGLHLPVRLFARVTKDATGSECDFAATGGSFNPASAQAKTTATVDVNGRAAVIWFPPAVSGRVAFTAKVGAVTGDTSLVVTPVPDIVLVGLPDTIATGETAQASVQVPPIWSGSAIEVRAPQGLLKTLGPVDDDLDVGTKILPLLDATGHAGFLVTAPSTAGQLLVTASLFGTVRSKTVEVR